MSYPHQEQPLPQGWVKEWDANHNAWYYVDTRQTPPFITWTDPRQNATGAAAPAGGDRGLMSSLGNMISGKPPQNAGANQYGSNNNNPYPPVYDQNHSSNQGYGGQASSYYNQGPQQSSYQAPPQPAPAAGGLGGLMSKIPGGIGGGTSGGAPSGTGGSKTNPLLAAAGGAGAAALAMKFLGGKQHSNGQHGHGHHGSSHHSSPGLLGGILPGHGNHHGHHHEHHHEHHSHGHGHHGHHHGHHYGQYGMHSLLKPHGFLLGKPSHHHCH